MKMGFDSEKVFVAIGVCLLLLIVLSWANAFAVYSYDYTSQPTYDSSYASGFASPTTSDGTDSYYVAYTDPIDDAGGGNPAPAIQPAPAPEDDGASRGVVPVDEYRPDLGTLDDLCYDTDMGRYYGMAGQIVIDGRSVHVDTCEASDVSWEQSHALTEWYCDDAGEPQSVTYDCGAGNICVDGTDRNDDGAIDSGGYCIVGGNGPGAGAPVGGVYINPDYSMIEYGENYLYPLDYSFYVYPIDRFLLTHFPFYMVTYACSDSDGRSPLIRGWAVPEYVMTDNQKRIHPDEIPDVVYADSCIDDSTVKEYYCDSQGSLKSEVLSCPDGTSCFEGACLYSSNVCSDSDGGMNPSFKGLISGTTLAVWDTGDTNTLVGGVSVGPYEDYCMDERHLIEYWCDHQPGSNLGLPGPGGDGSVVAVTQISCSCEDGACVDEPMPINPDVAILDCPTQDCDPIDTEPEPIEVASTDDVYADNFVWYNPMTWFS